jgi:hypothetical protein
MMMTMIMTMMKTMMTTIFGDADAKNYATIGRPVGRVIRIRSFPVFVLPLLFPVLPQLPLPLNWSFSHFCSCCHYYYCY